MDTFWSPHRGRQFAVLTAITVAAAIVGAWPAHADDRQARSYVGCPLLIEGDEGACVQRLQGDLNAVDPDYRLPETGIFGPRTRIAVLDFQGQNGLDADGNVGGETADVLVAALPPATPAGPDVSSGPSVGPVEDPLGDEIALFCSPIPVFGGICEYLLTADPAF